MIRIDKINCTSPKLYGITVLAQSSNNTNGMM